MSATHVLNKAGRFFDRLLDLFAIFAGVIASFITVAVCVGIISRYFLNRPISWVVEISEYGLLYMTFLSVAWVLKHEQHVSVDLVYSRLSEKKKAVATLFTSIVAAIVFTLITYYGFKVTKGQFDTKYFTPTILEAPKFAITLIIPIGTLLLLIQILRKIYRLVTHWAKGDASPVAATGAEGGLQVEP